AYTPHLLPHHSPTSYILHPFPTRRSSDLFAYPHSSRDRSSRALQMPAPIRGPPLSSSARAIATASRSRFCASSSRAYPACRSFRSEEHTSELQSRFDLVCRLLLEKKNTTQ